MKIKYLIQRLGFALIISMLIIASADTVTDAQVNNEWDVYLPLIMKNYPITPLTPVLNPISNQDGNGSYSVSWSSSEGASTYLLQEDDNANFSSPMDLYEGSSTSKEISGRDIGTYHYRVMATNSYASSGWSNVESVAVTVALPECPQAGQWRGLTSQEESVSFIVQDSPQCQIKAGSLNFGWDTYGSGCYYDANTTFNIPFDIINDKFDASNISDRLDALEGTFTSKSMVEGSFLVNYTVITPFTRTCTASGTWDAQPIHGVTGDIYAIQVLNDGDILIGGSFSHVNQTERHNIARLNPDGTLDGDFNTDVNSYVYSIAQQADGKILIGGSIGDVNGQVVNGIARLNGNGSLDTSFNSDIISINTGPWAHIYTMDVLSDGDILVGGEFDEVDGQERNYVAKLNPDGSLDANFNANIDYGYTFIVNAITVSGNLIYIGGEFVAGEDYWTSPHNLVRLNPDGSLDESFNAQGLEDITVWEVNQIGVQADDKIIVLHSDNIVRLNQDGTVDTSFLGPSVDAFPLTLAIQDNGKILVGGWFSDHLLQLESNGTQNPTFNPDLNNGVLALVIQPDGKILIAGGFTRIDEDVRHGIARLNPDGSVDTTFDPGP